jgi:hypothetical protein
MIQIQCRIKAEKTDQVYINADVAILEDCTHQEDKNTVTQLERAMAEQIRDMVKGYLKQKIMEADNGRHTHNR